jgi:hypothetical protein
LVGLRRPKADFNLRPTVRRRAFGRRDRRAKAERLREADFNRREGLRPAVGLCAE